MKSIGEILKAERLKQEKTILQVHKKTKIPEERLKALEANDFTSLPPATFTQGYIRSYAQVLGLDPKQLTAIFKRDWQEGKKGEIIPKGLEKPIDKQSFGWTPKMTLMTIISIIAALFLSYFGFQLTKYFLPPDLVLEQPEDNQKINQEAVEVKGKVSQEASLYINNQLVDINEDGNFSYSLKLFPGENTIEVKAVSRRNKETIISRKVVVDK